tara:strand:+ start:273 stop:431 length:159 start_codon:yes stop_codon:yes gene_type:complete
MDNHKFNRALEKLEDSIVIEIKAETGFTYTHPNLKSSGSATGEVKWCHVIVL